MITYYVITDNGDLIAILEFTVADNSLNTDFILDTVNSYLNKGLPVYTHDGKLLIEPLKRLC